MVFNYSLKLSLCLLKFLHILAIEYWIIYENLRYHIWEFEETDSQKIDLYSNGKNYYKSINMKKVWEIMSNSSNFLRISSLFSVLYKFKIWPKKGQIFPLIFCINFWYWVLTLEIKLIKKLIIKNCLSICLTVNFYSYVLLTCAR